ncbi:MAG: aspartyl/asparaginyl beta-hydroxylase domain-containing protein [Bacteroidota bacterium]
MSFLFNIPKRPFYSFSDRIKKGTKEDYFFDPEGFEWAKMLEENYAVIKQEIIEHMQSGSAELKPYFAKDMMNLPGKWKTFSFYFWGIEGSQKAINACPKTVSFFSSIPGITSFSVSVMEPQSEIKPHRGDTDAIYRCHLGIEIPDGLPRCGFYVGYEERPWENGKLLVFNDAAYHKAWNKTDRQRVIILFDVLRAEYVHQKQWICSRILGALLFSLINQKLHIIRNPGNYFRRVFCYGFALPVFLTMKLGIKKSLFVKLLTPD